MGSIFCSTSGLTLCTLTIHPLKLCFFVSFQYHSPVLHETINYYTCSFQHSTTKSLQIYPFFQVKDYNVKMEDLKRKKSPLRTKTVYITEKLLCISGDQLKNVYNSYSIKVLYGLLVSAEATLVLQKFPAATWHTVYMQFLHLQLHQARVNTIIIPITTTSAQNAQWSRPSTGYIHKTASQLQSLTRIIQCRQPVVGKSIGIFPT